MAIAVLGGYDIFTLEGIQDQDDDNNTFYFNFSQEIDPNEVEKAVLTLVYNSDNKKEVLHL